jgi:cytochrome P450
LVLIEAANRDPAQFVHPGRLDLTRRRNPHMAFGRGPHACIGAPLARFEAQLTIGTVLTRSPILAFSRRRYAMAQFHGDKRAERT